MAAGLPQSRCRLFQHLLFSLWALQGGLVTSNPGVKVTQQPPVVSKRQGETLELSCGVNQVNWFFYWYRQQPGEPKLQYFGTFSTYSSDLEDDTKSSLDSRLSGKRKGNETTLYLKDLQLSDTGLYLCASKDTVTVAASVTVTKLTTKQYCFKAEMAAGLPQSRCGLFQHLLFSLWTLQGGLVTSTSGVEVTQHPTLANKRQGETLELSCDVHQKTYHYYCAAPKYASPSESKVGRRARKEPSRRAGSSWEDFARGAREAAVLCEQAYFADTGTQLIVEDENCQRSQPTVHLLGPVCHKDHVTLVCVAQGFPYEWPIDVSWKRDAQEVTRLSFATDPVRTLNGTCNFGVSSRLSMTAAEWQERHVYSCHVRQGNIAEAEESMEREPSQQPGVEERIPSHKRHSAQASTVLEFQSSLHTGQLIFLLLVVKSFAYGTALGIYTACKKKTGL
uniref:uncharacterized protein LOC114584196 n=1 Tax=Podarcis muralis TaxID=64176 RepID=UPI0010A07C75|nr:uncharacterized protein LOC114584196 [Podarcis muralis]